MTKGNFPGHVLRERREALGYSLADIYVKVHIPPRYASALEDGEFAALGAPTYAQGFLTSYCNFLEIDAEPMLDAYRSATHTPGSNHYAPRVRRNNTVKLDGRPLWVSDLLAWGALCAVLVLCWLTYAAITQPFTEDAENRVDAGVVSIEPPVLFEDEF